MKLIVSLYNDFCEFIPIDFYNFLKHSEESKYRDIPLEYRYLKPSLKSRYVTAGIGLLLLAALLSGLYFLHQSGSKEKIEPVESVETHEINSSEMPSILLRDPKNP